MNDDDKLGLIERCLNHNKEDDLLKMLLDTENEQNGKDWKRRMVAAEYAYHVTNFPKGENDDNERREVIRTFSKLKWHLANDFKYDRQLVGLSCVFFTTTRLKNKTHDELLNESPYPAYPNGEKHWRVCRKRFFLSNLYLSCAWGLYTKSYDTYHERKPFTMRNIMLFLSW